jgi:hypothetical protein
MQFHNYTPFAGNAWETVNADGQWFATALVRARFKLLASGQKGQWHWQPDPEQGDLFAEDQFYRDDIDSSVRYESDYVSYKPAGDLIVNACTYAPGGEAQPTWNCSVHLYTSDDQCINRLGLTVQSRKNMLRREVASQIPIRYEHCFGGILRAHHLGLEDETLEYNLYNPVGCGRHIYPGEPECTVQINYQDNPLKHIPPGFGAIHRSWKSRLDLAGTYDQNWTDKQHPLPPHDFNFHHNQAAHPQLTVEGYFQPGSTVYLENLVQGEKYSRFTIPDYRLMARIDTLHEQRIVRMVLDTLLVDIDSREPADFRVYASWRAYIKLYGEAQSAEVMLIPPSAKSRGVQRHGG